MTRRQHIAVSLLFGMALALLLAVYFQVRAHYQRGEHAAYYTTLREDPMGASALYEALAALPSLTVIQNLRGILPELEDPDQTLVYLGAGINPDPVSFLETVEAFVEAGGRLVIALSAESYWDLQDNYLGMEVLRRQLEESVPLEDADETDEQAGEVLEEDSETTVATEDAEDSTDTADPDADVDAGAEDGSADEDADAAEPLYQDISERWGFGYGYVGESVGEAVETVSIFEEEAPLSIFLPGVAMLNAAAESELHDAALSDTLPWRSRVYFTDLAPEWTPLYTVEEDVVVMRRTMGSGEILLLSDSYVFSNESLKYELRVDFVGWALGGRPRIVFNETHLGSGVQGNLMTLIRRYRLSGFLVAFLSIGLLYVWRSTVSLLPRRPDVEATQLLRVDAYHDATTTLSHLLRRGLSYRQLLQTAYEEWKKSRGMHAGVAPENEARILDCLALPPQRDYGSYLGARTRLARDALTRYNELVALLRQEEQGGGRLVFRMRQTAPSPGSSVGDTRASEPVTPPSRPLAHTETELSGKDER